MLDIVGIGVLNVDLTATSQKLRGLEEDRVKEAMKSFEFGAERLAGEEEIERIVSLLGRHSFREALGGSAFNTICCLAATGSGLKAGFAGSAGETGSKNLSFPEAMDSLGVDRTHVFSCGGEPSGLCVSLNQSGKRSFMHFPGCNRNMAWYLKQHYVSILEYVSGSRLLHITQFSGRETSEMLAKLAEDAREVNPSLLISCDPGYSWLKSLEPPVKGILKHSDFLFLNDMEFSLLAGGGASDTDKAGRIFTGLNLERTLLVVKQETEIKLFRRNGGNVEEAAFGIDVIRSEEVSDATGAGDAFDAGFLAAVLLGEAAGRKAVELGMMLMRAKLSLAPESLREGFSAAFARWKKLSS